MITGDHPVTARAIAGALGILGEGEAVIDGTELARLSPEELRERAGRAAVYARVNPEQKIRIVEALQARGEIVAMTGDGVNDAPALNRADVGIAMGRSGTDVAREASHLVLLDDNFATIVTAVREGRRIYDNIRKFIRYAMTGNLGEIWTIFLAPFLGLPIPLMPIHILWVNLVTDGLPGLALAVEPAERGLMRRPPRPPQENVFARGMWQHIVWVGLLLGGVCVATQAWAHASGVAHWQTMVFTVLALSQLGHVLAIRSERESLFSLGVFSNLPARRHRGLHGRAAARGDLRAVAQRDLPHAAAFGARTRPVLRALERRLRGRGDREGDDPRGPSLPRAVAGGSAARGGRGRRPRCGRRGASLATPRASPRRRTPAARPRVACARSVSHFAAEGWSGGTTRSPAK